MYIHQLNQEKKKISDCLTIPHVTILEAPAHLPFIPTIDAIVAGLR